MLFVSAVVQGMCSDSEPRPIVRDGEESAVLYTQFNGAPSSVYDPYGDGNGSDPSARSRWAAWEHPTGEDAVYLSWHSNAGGGTGTDTFYDSSGPVAGSADLASFVHNRVIDGIRGARFQLGKSRCQNSELC